MPPSLDRRIGRSGMRPLLSVGFGRHFRSRVLRPFLDAERGVRLELVTSLEGGALEFEQAVLPEFAARGIAPPKYVEDLGQAIRTIASEHAHPLAAINTPNALHFDQIRACVIGGLDVYVERPIVGPKDDLPELVELAATSGSVVFVGSQRRLEAPFQYVHDAVVNRHEYGRTATIRCMMLTGERPSGWRQSLELAGGGIVLDSGNHLLDCAAWVVADAGDGFGAGSVRYAGMGSGQTTSSGPETAAVGHLVSEAGANLLFDFSYDVPQGSVYELLEFIDGSGNRIRVERNMARRTSQPGTVSHQRADGSIVALESGPESIRLDHAYLSDTSRNGEPFRALVRARDTSADPPGTHPCAAPQAVPGWALTRMIYGSAYPA